ncbi:MAG TPA: family 16 glycoside hydrolase [Planctomycetaceae bacterium]|nr:family 16 glycoside hydrolase [Planctomycetaceae bacterium]
MGDQSLPAESHDPRVDAALHDYLERIDQGETLDPASFVAEHPEIAAELRSLIDAEVQLRKLAAREADAQSPDSSTRSFALHGQETVAPQAKRPGETEDRRLNEQFGRYRILKLLGQGAMGTVYLAEDSQLKRQVALKTPHFDKDPTGELLERLYREARAAATLRHPNICPVHDVGEIEGTHYISMAYIEGHPLSAFIRANKPQPERQILIVVRKLAQALQEAHDHKIVHRDLKPANIMVDKRGEPLIMDFGLARHTRADDDVRLTHSGTLVGTPAYMSPEQVDGNSENIGPLTDEYSLGVILYELLTSQLPFRGSMMAVLGQIVTKEAPAPSQIRAGLDPRIDAACLKMMAKNPSDRFPSLSAVAEELAAILRNPEVRPASTDKSTAGFTLPSAEGLVPSEAGASQILKSQKQKRLTASDLESLEELARKCWSRHDYDQVIQLVERIPEDKRNANLQTLLEKAGEKTDEIAFLLVAIDEAVRLEDRQTALKKAEALLKIKPGHHRALEVQEQFGGEGGGGAVRIGPKTLAKAWSEGGWIPWSALAFGLAVMGVVAGVIIWWVNGTAIIIDVKDPGIIVDINGKQATINIPGKHKITVEPGDGQLSVSYEGLETQTKKFQIKKGESKILTVAIVDNKLVAQFAGEILPLITDGEKGKNVGNVPVEPKQPSPNSGAAPAAAANAVQGALAEAPARSNDGYVPLFNGKNLSGWSPDNVNQPGAWRVEHGILSGGPAGPASFLYSDREYKNFRLRVEARLKDNQHSELWVRTQMPPSGSPNRDPTVGFEVALKEPAGREPRTGSIWAVTPKPEGGRIVSGFARKEPMVQPDSWFTLEVVAEGKHVYVLVNGEVACKTNWFKRDQHESGRIAIEQHVDEPSVEFRKIEIKELPDSPDSSIAAAKRPTRSLDKDALVAPFEESQARAAQQKWSDRLKTPVDLTNTIGVQLRLIPPGEYRMGADDGADFVRPEHTVRITRPFYLGTYEVTRGQFAAFVARNHQFKTHAERGKGGWRLDNNTARRAFWEPKHRYTWRSPGFPQDESHPVVDVCWDDAQEFCRWLSGTEKKTYRLPTEAEWEYAARAGTLGGQYNGRGDITQIANVADASTKDKFPAWHGVNSSDGFLFSSPVGQFRPNNFGLYDMLGNALEWCSDWHSDDYYKSSPSADPPGAPAGKLRSARGGSFAHSATALNRWPFTPDHHGPDSGFRVVCEVPIAPLAEPAPVAAPLAAGGNRHAWVGAESRFDEIAPDKWRETFPKQPGHANFFFDVVARTPDFIELIDKTRLKEKGGVSVRLGDDQALMRWGGPGIEFKPLQPGQWVITPQDQDAAVTPSDDGFVPLFNGTEFKNGWKTHQSQRGNWHVEKGILIGAGSATSHLYTKRGDFKDFTLRLEARINAGGNSGVIFRSKFGPAWPTNNPKFPLGYEAQIDSTAHTAKTGSLFVISGGAGSGSAVVSIRESPVPAGEWFTMEVMAKASHIVIKVNDQETANYSDSHFRSGHIALQQHDANTVVEFRNIRIQELSANASTRSPASRPQNSSFFNGRSLAGWEGLPGFWHVRDHALVGSVPQGSKSAHTFLCSKREFRDFEIKFRARLAGGVGNSGFQFRSKFRDPNTFWLVGPQCEICAQDRKRKYPTGSLVTEPTGEPSLAPKAADVDRIFKLADFNDFEIRCVGKHVWIKLNGLTTVDADFPSMPDEGFIGWQMHGGNPPREVTFKDIEFTDLSSAKTPGGGL